MGLTPQRVNVYTEILKSYGLYDNVNAYLSKDVKISGKAVPGNNIAYAKVAFDKVEELGECVVLALDVEGFFDFLDHSILKKNLSKYIFQDRPLPDDFYKVFRFLTKPSYISHNKVEGLKDKYGSKFKGSRVCDISTFREHFKNKKRYRIEKMTPAQIRDKSRKPAGIPQGTPISAQLSNIYMIEFDVAAKTMMSDCGGYYFRYSDDILLISPLQNAYEVLQNIGRLLSGVCLKENESKRSVVCFKKGDCAKLRSFKANFDQENNIMVGNYKPMQYLGFEFDGKNVSIRKTSIAGYQKKMNRLIVKTLRSAYGRKAVGRKIFTRKIFNRYSHKGKRNFASYAVRANKIFNSPSIKRQVRRIGVNLSDLISKKNEEFYNSPIWRKISHGLKKGAKIKRIKL